MGHLAQLLTTVSMEENVRGTYLFPVPRREFNNDVDNLQRRVGMVWFVGKVTGDRWETTRELVIQGKNRL